MNDLLELKDELKNATSADDFIIKVCRNTSFNAVSYGYIAGVIDALYYAGKLNQERYTYWYHEFGL